MMSKKRLPSILAEYGRFPFTGLGGQQSCCRLRLFDARTIGKVTAVVTEISDSTGSSVTNSAASLAGAICDEFEIEPSKLVLIEHYREERVSGATFDESYSRVNLAHHPSDGFKRLDWKYLKLDDVARLTDTPVEEWMPSPVEDDDLEGIEA